MPIYEYRCELCGHELETIQRFSEPALTDCPACGKDGLKKLVSASGFQLKGTGWYVTDFKNNGKKKAEAGSDSKTGPVSDKKEKKASGSKGDGD